MTPEVLAAIVGSIGAIMAAIVSIVGGVIVWMLSRNGQKQDEANKLLAELNTNFAVEQKGNELEHSEFRRRLGDHDEQFEQVHGRLDEHSEQIVRMARKDRE